MPVELVAGPVVTHRRAWIGVPGGDLHVAEVHSSIRRPLSVMQRQRRKRRYSVQSVRTGYEEPL